MRKATFGLVLLRSLRGGSLDGGLLRLIPAALRLAVLGTGAELVDALGIDSIDPSLVQIDEEDDIVSETSDPVHHGHFDNECEYVVNESVQELVRQHAPRQMRDRFEFVVDEKLWCHHDEAEGQQEAVHHRYNE